MIESPGEYEMTLDRIHAFAAEYDPQSIHVDPEAARHAVFGGNIASGWHSLSATMRLMVESR